MARRFQRGRSSIPPQRRLTDWIGGDTQVARDEVNLAGSASVLFLSFDTRTTGQQPDTPFTIVRTRGLYNFFPNTLTANLFVTGAIGMAVINGEAFDVGITAMPTPWSESFDDRWFFHEYWSSAYIAGASTANELSNQGHVIDSKAMRKVNFGDVIVTVIENASSDAITFFVNHRLLVKVA